MTKQEREDLDYEIEIMLMESDAILEEIEQLRQEQLELFEDLGPYLDRQMEDDDNG